ncbi:hypothetical protein ABAC402_14925 [Asticcacaulis sp. AC402]|nr:hypothetical protein ABAC402_14925 [Asticcacaulis sp. AC402]
MYGLWIVWTVGGNIAAAVCCLWAFWRGGTFERWGASILAVGWILTMIAKQPGMGPNAIIVGIDCAALLAFVVLALWSRRIWVFFAAACQLNAVFSHFAHHFTDFGIYSYATANGFWGGWALIFCLAAGVASYRRRYNRQLKAATAQAPTS